MGDQPRPAKKTAKNRRKSASANEPEFVQLLNPGGQRVDHPDYALDLSDEEYRGLYRDLVITRELDAQGTALQRQGQLGLWPSLLGQEAAQVGSGRALREQDTVFPAYRELGVQWCRGIDLLSSFALFRGVDLGGRDVAADRFHMYSIVIASQTLHAAGYAMGVAKDGAVGSDEGEAVVVYHGDGATSEGDFNEALIWAGVFNAPLVLFCQNNQYAISETNARQFLVPPSQRAAGFGVPGILVDGNDVLATYAVTKSALDRARHGEGPSLIEAYTYRMQPHTTSDDATRYRDEAELDQWRAKDPILRYRTWLEAEGLAGGDYFAEIDAEADREVRKLRDRVISLTDPEVSEMFDSVYAEPVPQLAAQRAEAVAFRASLDEGSES
ncbi:pyruvate dehydrogenase (acetyl-transferring) E1 component subunit alpha [Glycomyces buryatensis]|uniref:Pyruvate dehydrogenase (Acetyl-transferring) E1 component subunit alpha n=1 Tax=Glycomyces buryatensis TaxID=2570927 RepID=A0A4S8QAN9_9ACTN|nr:pyruvate dehydrogenase (acetyl-transferring) E1 component subunit alpha [Glycomyces buryatensis]THV41573.1 pyruvate dehydrogenase (acetyl-transferring) E1 component subunit alpha [Glycomyces buryatensis]